jgi:hypothetical protein
MNLIDTFFNLPIFWSTLPLLLGSPDFHPDEIVQPTLLAKKLVAGTDPVSARLRSQLPAETLQALGRASAIESLSRRDLARAQWRGDRGDIREESRELRRAEREFRQDRANLYRAGWGGGRDDDRRRGRDWDDDRRGRGRDRDWDRGRGNDRWGRDYDDRWDDGWRRGRWNNDWGWRGPPPWAQVNGRRGQDWAWRRDGWNRPGWHAENFHVDNRRYRPRVLGYNDPIWRGYDNRYYCRRSDGTTGLIVGGLAGGTLGNVIAPGGSKLLGSIIGGTLGAVLGQSADRGRVVCR